VDAAPSPDGKQIYYAALSRGNNGEDAPGVFRVTAPGSAIETLTSGGQLDYPVGIATSLDGKRLFIADRTAGASARGGLFQLNAQGGELSSLSWVDGPCRLPSS
jgi:Tol biopolymer transport system component